ncbi:MAG: hypothetical protein COZ87_03610, partial [Candidatus Moranbacteria bacterium CG_4_8_14_3_um_filter_43_15]
MKIELAQKNTEPVRAPFWIFVAAPCYGPSKKGPIISAGVPDPDAAPLILSPDLVTAPVIVGAVDNDRWRGADRHSLLGGKFTG